MAKWVDSVLLLKKRYVGREWNKHDFVWEEDPASSRTKSLWSFPPPSIKDGSRLCLNQEHLSQCYNGQWSQQTVQHMHGIHFCYFMLRDDYIKNSARNAMQSKTNNSNRAKGKSASTNSVLTDPTTNNKHSYQRQQHNNDNGKEFLVYHNDQDQANKNRSSRVISLSSQNGENTDHLWGLSTACDQMEGIELVRESPTRSSYYRQQQHNNQTNNHQNYNGQNGHQHSGINYQFSNDSNNSLAFSETERITMYADEDTDTDSAEDRDTDDANFTHALDEDDRVDEEIYLDAEGSSDGMLGDSLQKSVKSSSTGSIVSCSSEAAADMHWIDLTAKIGIRLLNSAHLQQAVASQETAERIMDISKKLTNATDITQDIQSSSFATDTGNGVRGNLSMVSNVSDAATTTAAAGMTQQRNKQFTRSQSDMGIKKSPARPVHSMWTNPAANMTLNSSFSDIDEGSVVSDLSPLSQSSWAIRNQFSNIHINASLSFNRDRDRFPRNGGSLPPLSPPRALSPNGSIKTSFTRSPILSRIPQRCRQVRSSSCPSSPLCRTRDDLDLLKNKDVFSKSFPTESIQEEIELEQLISKSAHATDHDNQDDNRSIHSEINLRDKRKKSAVQRDLLALPDIRHVRNKSCFPDFLPSSTATKAFKNQHNLNLHKKIHRRAPLKAGVKMVVPIFPFQPHRRQFKVSHEQFQMATVVSSERIYVGSNYDSSNKNRNTNCLSVTCILDKSFLRNGQFSKLTFRVMDEWSNRYMPKHSKVPIGACILTSYGIGVLVGWRVEDDCHVIRSLWLRRGPGSAHAYLRRDAIKCIVKAASGFDVQTKCGAGKVLAYVGHYENSDSFAGDSHSDCGQYVVSIQEEGVLKDAVVHLNHDEILSCVGAQFIPVIEHIREAANYQIQLDNYKAFMREQKQNLRKNKSNDTNIGFNNNEKDNDGKNYLDKDLDDDDDFDSNYDDLMLWKMLLNKNLDILWNSFLKAVDEDKEFDDSVNLFMSSIIDFLERIDKNPSLDDNASCTDTTINTNDAKTMHNDNCSDFDAAKIGKNCEDSDEDDNSIISGGSGDSTNHHSGHSTAKSVDSKEEGIASAPGFWILNDMFGGVFHKKSASANNDCAASASGTSISGKTQDHHQQRTTKTETIVHQTLGKYNTWANNDCASKASTENTSHISTLKDNYCDNKSDAGSVASCSISSNKTNFSSIAKPDNSALHYKSVFAVLRILMKTVSLARASSDAVGRQRFRLAMTLCYEFLLFIRTIIKVQQKNVSPHSLAVWNRALYEIKSTFGPMKERLEKIGRGIAKRMEQQGRKAKIRLFRCIDTLLADEIFLASISQARWEECIHRIELATIKAKIMDEDGCKQFLKTAQFVYSHLGIANLTSINNDEDNNNTSKNRNVDGSFCSVGAVSATDKNNKYVDSNSTMLAASHRNNEKFEQFIKAIQCLASPKRSLLKIIRQDSTLELIERILVRVFHREELASRMLMVHASNLQKFRHLRILKDLSVAGRLWIPLLDAADEELSWVVSSMPDNAKEYICPLSSLFSLCVAQFHKMINGQISRDWLDFLMEEDAVNIIHDIDMKLILSLESFSRDVKEMMVVLPYYSSFDDDILNLMDEVELDEFLKEASAAMDDSDKLFQFIREKTTIAIERFLGYLPKMSIPVERRDLGDGWVLTCRGEDGGDLTLSDVKVQRENLVCEVMGGNALFLPMFVGDDADNKSVASSMASHSIKDGNENFEESILDQIRDLILQAQSYGCWQVGVGGVGQPPSQHCIPSVLQGLPVTSVLSCAIELWRNLEIDDDELLEIAIRDVSYQIKLHAEIEEKESAINSSFGKGGKENVSFSGGLHQPIAARGLSAALSDSSGGGVRKRFNPRVDPTVLFLEMKNLTLHLEKFHFRIEKSEKKTLFDPVFEGYGTVSIQNVSILLRVECAKERMKNSGSDQSTPVLLLRELDVQLENVKFKVKDTGADWLFNKAVYQFSDSITSVVEANLKEQVREQLKAALQHINSYFLVKPDTLLNILGVTMDDLEENVVWV